MVTEAEVRRRLNKHLRTALDDEEWDLLDGLGDVGDLVSDARDELSLGVAQKIKKIRATYRRTSPAGSTAPDQSLAATRSADVGERSTAFALALSENIAAVADRDPQTDAFRTAHLPGGLIQLDQVEAWIAQRVQEQPAEVRQARVRIPVGWQSDEPLPFTGAAVFVDQLPYVASGYTHVRKVVVAPGGILGSLRRLAAGLAAAHGWEPAQAATWVLTGVTPLVGLIRVTEGRENIRNSWWMAWSERITLDVHAAASPDEVAEAYRAARARHDARRTGGNYRARSQSIPHLVLARFVARRRENGEHWEDLRVAWNAWIAEQTEYTGLRHYDSVSTFRRDAPLACKRVLYRGYYVGRRAATEAATEDVAEHAPRAGGPLSIRVM
ncbi:MAG: hypothetical protein M3291_01055 [Actinomycetota bacterium]|nr:hypothetical protein [Actinomycetota bacterium]